MPIIQFSDCPLSEAARALATESGAEIIMEPRLAEWADKVTVSLNFTNASPWGALNGMLGNYGVELVRESGSKSLYRLRVRP